MDGPRNAYAAQITSASQVDSFYYGKPQFHEWSTDNAIKDGFKASSVVFACISRISKAAASVPWKVVRKGASASSESIDNHPLIILFNNPNKFMSRQDVIERLTQHLFLGGNGILSKTRVRGVPVELWPLAPDRVSPIPDEKAFISTYEITNNGKLVARVSPTDVIHIMFPDPANPYWGMGHLQVLARIVDTDVEAVRFNKVALQNRAVTDGVFTVAKDLSPDQWARFRGQVKEQHQGADNARAPWVLGNDAKWTQMGMKPVEMDFINSRKFSREEIASAFGVPPPMIGYYEQATLANLEVSRKIFWLDTVIPYLDDLQDAFNIALTPEFGGDIELRYDISNVDALQAAFADRVDAFKNMVSSGVPMNIAANRVELGIPTIEGGDTPLVNRALVSLNALLNEAETSTSSSSSSSATSANRNAVSITVYDAADKVQLGMFWKWVSTKRAILGASLHNNLESILIKYADVISGKYRKYGSVGIDDASVDMSTELSGLLKDYYSSVMSEFASETFNSMMIGSGRFDTLLPADSRQLIDSRASYVAFKKAAYIASTTAKVASDIAASYSKSGDIDMKFIASQIRASLQSSAKERAATILNTESTLASNLGSYIGADYAKSASGSEIEKIWVAQRDSVARDSHALIDGKVLAISDKFVIDSHELLYPGDVDANPSEVINCRCSVAFRVGGR